MVWVDSIYLRQGLIVLDCGYFLIHMELLYPKKGSAWKCIIIRYFIFVEYWYSFIASFIFKNL